MNTYIAFYRNNRREVNAATSYQAQQAAAILFKAKRSHEVTVMLAQCDGRPVIHSTCEL